MKRVLIIAEAGVNHNGNLAFAKKLIDVAAKAGADIVKFQTFKTENLVSKSAKKASYQKANMSHDADDSQFEMLKKLELSESDHVKLIAHCEKKKIEFWSTAFDEESLQLLRKLGIRKWKIPSGEITNLPFLKAIGKLGQEIILSTGMSNLKEIGDALAVLKKAGTPMNSITVLHCNTEYPTPMHDVNLKAMLQIKKQFGVKTGYSDHTEGVEVSVAAVALGAEVIEKHFTLDKNMDGPDHKASLEPDELKAMVHAIRNIETALGDGKKKPSGSEKKNMISARKSIVAAKPIRKGEFYTASNLTTKRPGNGISPMKWEQIIGKKAKTDLKKDDLIK